MGDIADAMMDGLFCSQCGRLIDGEEPGHSRLCGDCEAGLPLQGLSTVERNEDGKKRRRKRTKQRRRRQKRRETELAREGQ